MAISYNAGTNTITLDGVNTYTLLDIYNADVAGAWGVVARHGGNSYFFGCNLTVGSGTDITQLVDTGQTFQLASDAARKNLKVTVNSVFSFTKSLLTFYLLADPNFEDGELKFESCGLVLKGAPGGFFYKNKLTMKHTIVTGSSSMTVYTTFVSGVMEDVTIDGIDRFGLRTENLVMDDVKLKNMTYALTVYHFDVMATLKNTTFSGNTTDLWLYNSALPRATFINCVFDNTKLNFQFAGNYLLEKYEFNLLVTDKDNNPLAAGVELKDKNGVVKHSAATGADGKLPSPWEVLANRYDGTSETKTEYNPFTLTVTKAGYADYETKITIDHIVKGDQVVLDALTYTYDEIMDGLTDIKGTGFVKDTHSLTDLEAYVDENKAEIKKVRNTHLVRR